MQASVNPVASGGAQQTVQAGPMYGIGHHGSSSTIAYGGPYMPYSSSTIQSSNNQQEHGFPERPGQPECQYYMRTGDCKFGATCKYHHPRDWSSPKSNYMFSPFCLPLRPGAQPCSYYAQNGYCRYGVACKYDHPMAKDPSVNQVGSPVAGSEPSGSILPKGVFPPDTVMRAQTNTTTAGSSSPGGGR